MVKSEPNLVMVIYSTREGVRKMELWVHPPSQEDTAGRVNEDM